MKKTVVVSFSIPIEDNEEVENFRKSYAIPISRSIIYREGAKLFIEKMKQEKELKVSEAI